MAPSDKGKEKKMRKKSSIALIISIVVGIIVIGSVIGLSARMDKLDTTKTVGTFMTYEVGKLDQETGKGMSKSAIEDCEDYDGYMHLKSYINADGLTVKLAEKAKVEYKVYYFDESYQPVSNTGWLTEDYTAISVSSDIKYAMVEVAPTADPDGIISNIEITTYAKMLTVTYNK